jgi:hypothetical protein
LIRAGAARQQRNDCYGVEEGEDAEHDGPAAHFRDAAATWKHAGAAADAREPGHEREMQRVSEDERHLQPSGVPPVT